MPDAHGHTTPRPTNSDLAGLSPSGIRRFNALARQTPGCVSLTLGEPEFDTPRPIRDVVAVALDAGMTHYPPNNGTPELLDAISSYMASCGLNFSASQVVVCAGATEALYATLASLLDPLDEVIVPTPAFGLYETIVRSCHGRVRTLDTSADGFQVVGERLSALVGPRTKAIVVNSPNNPTGCVLDAASLDAVAEVAARAGIYVVCDDVYARLVYDDGFERFSTRHPELADRTVVVESFSKPWAMTGWRLGWLATSPGLKSQIEKTHQYMVSSVPAFVQPAAAVALGCDVAPMRMTYAARRDRVVRALGRMGMPCERPAGAFYAFPRVAGAHPGAGSSEEFCVRAIREAGVALVPGTCFGCEGYARLSFCCSDELLDEGLRRLAGFVAAS